MHKGIGSGWVGWGADAPGAGVRARGARGRMHSRCAREGSQGVGWRSEEEGRGVETGCIGTKPLVKGDIVLIIIIYDLSGEAVP